MAEANRSMEEIVEPRSVHSASSSTHRPIGPFGPIPKNSGMEMDGTFARTPIVAGEMPRRHSNTSTVGSAAYHTVQGSGTDGSESAGYRTTSEHQDTSELATVNSLLPSQLAKNYKAHTYWSRSSGDSSSAHGSVSAERTRRTSAAAVTSGSSSRSEPAASAVRPRGASRREEETAEAMTYEERRSARSSGRRSSDHERFQNVSSSAESSVGQRRSFPFQRADNGGMRVTEGMVAYQDGNLAILVADPVHTRLKVQAKEKHAKSTGSVKDHISADIHASYDNLNVTQQRDIHEVSPSRHSSAGSSHRSSAAHRERFYETSEHGSQRRPEAGVYTSHWEAESAARDRQSSTARSSRAVDGSQRGDGRAQSERSGHASAAGASRGSLSRRDSGFSHDPCTGSMGGSDSASSLGERSSSRRRSISPRHAASARLSPSNDTPATLQRVLQPTAASEAADGNETDGFATRFVRQETAGSQRAASATMLYMGPTATGATGATGRSGTAVAAGASRSNGAGYGRTEAGVDEVGYPRRASGDWRRRSSTAELVVEDEICDLEEREEVYSGAVKERLSRHRGDAESSMEKSARRSRNEQQSSYANERTNGNRYSGASGGQREKRELGCLSEEAVRSASSVENETDCFIEVDGTEVPIVSWAVRRYSRYLQQLGRRSPRRLMLPKGSGSPAALSTAVEWCYLPTREASRLITADNCTDIYRAACALEIPELMEQCRSYMDREEQTFTRDTVTYDASEYEDRSWRASQQQRQQQQQRQRGEDEEEEEEEGVEVVVDTTAAEELPSPQTRRRRSSFGSSSPKRSYSHLYTREEQEAAVVIQSGYRGFRTRQQLKDRGLKLGSSRSRQLSSTAASYSRRVSSSQSSQSRRLSSPPQRAEATSARSVSVVFDSSRASGQGSRADVQRQPPGSTQEVRQASRTVASQRELQRLAGVGTERRTSDSDGFREVYEHKSRVSAPPSQTASKEGSRRVSQTGSAHVSRVDTRSRSPSRTHSRSGSPSRVSFSGGQPPSSREEHAAVVIQRNYRAFSGHFHYEEQRYAAATLQRYMRGHLARKHVREMHEAAAKIQSCFRDHLDEKRGRIDPEVTRPVSRRVSSSSDWKCRTLLHPEGSTVLVMAGLNPMQDYCAKYNSGRDMYRYQAFQNAWEYVGQIPEPRHHASVVYLRGLVYLVGGTDPRYRDSSARCKALSTVWVLDPTTGDWSEGPPMKYARIHHGTVVAQSQLYVIGGQDENGCALTSVELFDPDRAAWSEVAPLGCARLGTATAVHHHRIWVVGGMCPAKKQDVVTTVDIYDTIRHRWCQGPSLRQPRCFARLVVCAHRLFLVGGAGRTTRHQKTISSVDTVDRFEEEQRAWVHVAQMKTSRHGHAVVPQSELEFLILGGVSSQDAAALSLVEQYNARSNQWIRGVAKLPSPLSGLAAVTIPPPRRQS